MVILIRNEFDNTKIVFISIRNAFATFSDIVGSGDHMRTIGTYLPTYFAYTEASVSRCAFFRGPLSPVTPVTTNNTRHYMFDTIHSNNNNIL